MKAVRALVFDDEPSQLSDVLLALTYEWERFRWPSGEPLPQLIVTELTDRTALQGLINHPKLNESFDFFFCDVYIGAPPDVGARESTQVPIAEGFRFLGLAKAHGMPLCFSVSTGQWGSHEVYQKARNAFDSDLDGDYLKSDLKGIHSKERPAEILAEIVGLLRSRGLVEDIQAKLTLGTKIQEARTAGIFKDVGRQTISAFASEMALPGATHVEFSSLSPGLSGAKILKLTYSGTKENYSTRPVLLKISRDRKALEVELENYREHLRKPLRPLAKAVATPRNVDTPPAEVNGWFAIAFECAAPATPLVHWLSPKPPSDEEVRDLLDELFIRSKLSDTYRSTAQSSSSIATGISKGMMTEYRRMAILEAIEAFQPLLDRHVKGKKAQLDLLSTFLNHERIQGVETSDLERRTSMSCLTHGDFHGRNVLIQHSGKRYEPVIIDIASMGTGLWTIDLVRLVCDIFLSGWDSGALSYEWSGLKSWMPLVSLFTRRASLPAEPPVGSPNRGVWVAVEWLMEHRFQIAGLADEPYHHAEFALSLAVEFARASYRDRDMTAPKRAFALVVSNQLFEDAALRFKAR